MKMTLFLLAAAVLLHSALGSLVRAESAAPASDTVPGALDPSFGAGKGTINASVLTMAILPDGDMLIGGGFSAVDGATSQSLARLKPDGSADPDFTSPISIGIVGSIVPLDDGTFVITNQGIRRVHPNGEIDPTFVAFTNGTVYSVRLISGGRFLIGGDFTLVNGVVRNQVAILNADGTLDTSFESGILEGFNVIVHDAIELDDGRIMIAGTFTAVDGNPRGRIARLNGDGSLDDTFLNGMDGANAPIQVLLEQSGGRIIAGGHFQTFNGAPSPGLVRLEEDGSLDPGFTPPETFGVEILLEEDGGTILAGTGGVIFRLENDGSVDTSSPPVLLGHFGGMTMSFGTPRAIAVRNDGRIMVAGEFDTVAGITRNRIARLNTDLTIDETFEPEMAGLNSGVSTFLEHEDGSIIVSGSFTVIDGTYRNGIARLNTDGRLDHDFDPPQSALMSTTTGTVFALAAQGEGMTLVGGDINKGIVRLLDDGTPDPGFLAGMQGVPLTSTVRAIVVQPDGQILIGGSFTSFNFTNANRLARLNNDGSLETTFMENASGVTLTPPHTNSSVLSSVVLQPDGKILIGGDFDAVNGTPRRALARLNADGTLDTAFMEDLSGIEGADSLNLRATLNAILLQENGRILISGRFERVNGIDRPGLARLHPDGSLDTSFDPAPIEAVFNDPFQAPGKILDVQDDGKILVRGRAVAAHGLEENHFFRLNPDGSRDHTFRQGLSPFQEPPAAASLRSDGSILVAGEFAEIDGMTQLGIARLIGGESTPIEAMNYAAWVAENFNLQQQAQSTLVAEDASPAGDGIANLAKYALGMRPFEYDPAKLPRMGLTLPANPGDPVFPTLDFSMLSADPDLDYRLELSADMKTWHYNGDELGGPYFEVQTTDNGNGTRSILARILEPASTGRAFVRVVFLY